MLKDPPQVTVWAVRIHMDPGSNNTSYGGIVANTFQGIATLITPSGPFKMEGNRWHLLFQVFSFSANISIDLGRKRLLQENMDKDTTCRSLCCD